MICGLCLCFLWHFGAIWRFWGAFWRPLESKGCPKCAKGRPTASKNDLGEIMVSGTQTWAAAYAFFVSFGATWSKFTCDFRSGSVAFRRRPQIDHFRNKSTSKKKDVLQGVLENYFRLIDFCRKTTVDECKSVHYLAAAGGGTSRRAARHFNSAISHRCRVPCREI